MIPKTEQPQFKLRKQIPVNFCLLVTHTHTKYCVELFDFRKIEGNIYLFITINVDLSGYNHLIK